MTAAVLTVSDGVAAGEREDRSGDLLAELLAGEGYEVVRRVVADEREAIGRALVELADEASLVLTTGGTGVAPRDVTPEATRDVLEREAPGLAELLRAHGRERTALASLSRGVAGTVGACLVLNLPGSPKAVGDGFDALAPVLDHALALLRGQTEHRG